MHADARQALAGHFGIVGALVVVGVNHDADVVPVLGEQRERACAAERIVIRVGREQQDGFAAQIFKPGLWLR